MKKSHTNILLLNINIIDTGPFVDQNDFKKTKNMKNWPSVENKYVSVDCMNIQKKRHNTILYKRVC